MDDQPLFAEGLRAAVETSGRMVVTNVVARCAEAMHEVRVQRPDIVIIGEQFRRSLFQRIRMQAPTSTLVLLDPNLSDAAATVRYAVPVLSRKYRADHVVSVLSGLARGAGGPSLDPSRNGSYPAGLTKREWEILQLLASGYTSVEIGKRLFLSTNTVRTYCQSLLRKLGARNRLEAVAVGRRLNIVNS